MRHGAAAPAWSPSRRSGSADVYRAGSPGLLVSEAPLAELLEDERRNVWVCGPGLGPEAARATLPLLLSAGSPCCR